MQAHVLAGIVLACATTAFASQTGSTQSSSPQTPLLNNTGKLMTLSGCVQGGDEGADEFTLLDAKDGTTYRLSGADVRPHVGRRLQIVGGLVPSPNVAAQAGAIDPAQAAIATASGNTAGGTGRAPLELRIKRVRPLSGACAQR